MYNLAYNRTFIFLIEALIYMGCDVKHTGVIF